MQADCVSIESLEKMLEEKGAELIGEYLDEVFYCNCGECIVMEVKTAEHDIEYITICDFCGKQ